tara:strand:+ start:347 stop:448 length:102 start_codon:yes stop_codon:yes gene_type:complete
VFNSIKFARDEPAAAGSESKDGKPSSTKKEEKK